MKSILQALWYKIWPKHLKKDFDLPVEFLTDAEAKERFKAVSQFVFEFQKQYFESLKFSLNMWMVINSGVAIALLSSKLVINQLIVVGFLLGAVCSGLGVMKLFVFSTDCLMVSLNFVSDKKLNYCELLTHILNRHKCMYRSAALFLGFSYAFFLTSAACLALS